MEITTELVEHLANLSRLEFNKEETEKFKNEFHEILKYVDEIKSIDTSNVVITRKKLNAKTELREDECKQGLNTQEVLKIAPKTMGSSIAVPAVVEE